MTDPSEPAPIAASVAFTTRETEMVFLQEELNRLTQRDNQIVNWMFGFVGVAAAVVATMVLGLPDYCQAECESGDITNEWVFLALPMPPLILATFLVFLTVQSNISAQLRNKVERRLAQVAKFVIPPEKDRGEMHPVEVPMSSRLIAILSSLGRGHKRLVPYHLLFFLMIFESILMLFFAPVRSYLQLPGQVQATLLLFYGPPTVLILWALFKAGRPGRGLLRDATEAYYEHAERDQEALGGAGRHRSDIPVALLRSVVPRFADHLMKIFIIPVAYAVGATSSKGFAAGQLDFSTVVGGVSRVVGILIVIEALVYQSRYIINDLRGIEQDRLHPDRSARLRSDGVESQGGLIILYGAVVVRLVLLLYTLTWLFDGRDRLLLSVVSIAILLAAIPYEWARSKQNDSVFTVSERSTGPQKFIWVWVGSGYALRAFIGFSMADGGHNLYILSLVILSLWLAEMGNVMLAWIAEASSLISIDRRHYEPALRDKPHVAMLAKRAGILDVPAKERAGANLQSRSSEKVNRRYSAGGIQPWTLAGFAAVLFGGVTGLLLSIDDRPALELVTGSIGLILVLGLALFAKLYRVRHLVWLLVPALIILGVRTEAPRWPFGFLVPVLVLAVYFLALESSYDDFKKLAQVAAEWPLRAALELLTGAVRLVAGRAAAERILGLPAGALKPVAGTGKPLRDAERSFQTPLTITDPVAIIDVDNTIRRYREDESSVSDRLEALLEQLPNCRKILFASNAVSDLDAAFESLVPDGVEQWAFVDQAHKPWPNAVMSSLSALDASVDDVMVVVGDLCVTDGLLAFVLNVPYWRLALEDQESLPRWPRMLTALGRPLERVLIDRQLTLSAGRRSADPD